MNTKKLACALVTALSLGVTTAAFAAPPSVADAVGPNRAVVISQLVQSWQQRIDSQGLAVEDARNWSSRAAAKLARLSDERLALAQRATTISELETLMVTAPIPNGMTLSQLMANTPGDITIVAPDKKTEKSDPTGSPTLYDDLVFTAVVPCRIYDSRTSQGGTGTWPAYTSNIVRIGPYSTGYAFQGGSATSCGLDTLATTSDIAAVMIASSVVGQSGAGYLTYYPASMGSPPTVVSQWFTATGVQTAFVVSPTDMIPPVWIRGYIAIASSDVIVDVIGYFARPHAVALDCQDMESGVTSVGAGSVFSISAPACPAGYSATGPTFRNTTTFSNQFVINNFYPLSGTYNCQGSNGNGFAVNAQCGVRCCRVPGR